MSLGVQRKRAERTGRPPRCHDRLGTGHEGPRHGSRDAHREDVPSELVLVLGGFRGCLDEDTFGVTVPGDAEHRDAEVLLDRREEGRVVPVLRSSHDGDRHRAPFPGA